MKLKGWILLFILGLAAPFVVYPIYAMHILSLGLFASAFGLVLGYTGLLSFGHAAFYGSAAYVCGLLIKNLEMNPLVGIIGGVLVALILGLLFGLLAIRRQGIYFSMITLALAQMIYFVILQTPKTGGEDGLQGIPRGNLFGLIDLNQPLAMYYFVFSLFILGMILIHWIIHSPFGVVLKSIRQHEPRAISLGYKADRFKLMAFVLSAGLSGLAGTMHALVFQLATLSDANWRLSGEVILMTLLGGVGTFLGPLLGSAVVVTLEHQLGDKVGSWIQVIIGCIFVFCVLLFRRGIIGEINHFLARRKAQK